MMRFRSRPTRAFRKLASLSIAASAVLLAIAAMTAVAAARSTRSGSHGGSRHVLASASRAVPRPLAIASARSRAADRTLVFRAKQLKRCAAAHRRHPGACTAARRALQRAGRRLRSDERALARVAGGGAGASWSHYGGYGGSSSGSSSSATQQAPKMTISGDSVSWTQVAGLNSYVFVRKVPGQADQYSTVTGTSVTPPPVPGVIVKYSVRTAVNGSAWAPEQSIAYPATETVDTQAAPKLTVSGLTLSWSLVGGVSTYVLAIKVPGQEERFTEVSGTSVTPATVPGVTVRYSLRTAVTGSAWSPEVAISYPAKSTPPPPPPPPPPTEPPPSNSSMWVSVDVGGWPSSFASDMAGAVSYVRINSQSSIAGFTAAGLRVIDCLTAENSGGVSGLNDGEYAAKVVAEVRANPELAALEVLNEPGNQWQGWGSSAGSAANAAAYDHLLKVVHEALVANFGSHYPLILASYDGGEGPVTWGEEMWAAEPNVGSYLNGITLHSYGGTSNRSHSALGSRDHIEQAHSQHPGIPIYVTEVGWPTAVGQPSTGDSLQWTEAEQAQNITNFVNWAKGTGYVADVTIFNYRDYGSNDWYGIESASGTHKLSYSALAAYRQ
jgi:hypothetical protein